LSFVLDFQNDGPGGAADFQTYLTPSLANVTSVWFRGLDYTNDGGAIFRLDNFVLDDPIDIQPVPEPASLILVSTACFTASSRPRRSRAPLEAIRYPTSAPHFFRR
jgi:hypothetical protein